MKQVVATRVASDSDAEAPRLVARAGGAYLAWIARRPEGSGGGSSNDIEALGEARSFSWVELAAIDLRGAPAGASRAVVPASSHVSAFDLALRVRAGAGKPAELTDDVDVFVRDDLPVSSGGASGRILRAAAHPDAVEPPSPMAADDVGRGAPDALVMSDGSTWLSWVDTAERLRVLPLDAARSPSAAASVEAALDDARALALAPAGSGPASGAGGSVAVLAAYPRDPDAQLRILQCQQ
jgi:hypothetical protein